MTDKSHCNQMVTYGSQTFCLQITPVHHDDKKRWGDHQGLSWLFRSCITRSKIINGDLLNGDVSHHLWMIIWATCSNGHHPHCSITHKISPMQGTCTAWCSANHWHSTKTCWQYFYELWMRISRWSNWGGQRTILCLVMLILYLMQ